MLSAERPHRTCTDSPVNRWTNGGAPTFEQNQCRPDGRVDKSQIPGSRLLLPRLWRFGARSLGIKVYDDVSRNACGSTSTNGQSIVRTCPSPAIYWQIGGGHTRRHCIAWSCWCAVKKLLTHSLTHSSHTQWSLAKERYDKFPFILAAE